MAVAAVAVAVSQFVGVAQVAVILVCDFLGKKLDIYCIFISA
jgi:hypothetical protein